MQLVNHGGKCCGMKTIHGFYNDPDQKVASLRELETPLYHPAGYDTKAGQRFFRAKAPTETRKRRLERYVAYCDKWRPNGIIEVVLTTPSETLKENYGEKFYNEYCSNQLFKWGPVLKELNFEEVTTCKNSNSGNTLHVFHRKSGEVPTFVFEEEPDKKVEAAAEPAAAPFDPFADTLVEAVEPIATISVAVES